MRVAGRGRRDEGGDEGEVDGAVEVQLQLEVLVDDGDALRQQVERVGHVGAGRLVLAGWRVNGVFWAPKIVKLCRVQKNRYSVLSSTEGQKTAK